MSHTVMLGVAGLLCALGLSGCVSLPSGGPVVETQIESDPENERPMSIDPESPRPGASAADIASGFLDAMEASPIRVDVARQFLVSTDQASWDPEESTIVHSGLGVPTEVGSTIAIDLSEPELLDRRGAWQEVLPPSQQRLQFDMVQEDGEFRIADPIDALVVSASWFEARYQQVSLHFFDRTARVLVPEPVFVPRGEQTATSLVEGLIAGPPEELGASGRTFIPSGAGVELSVPVSRDGVADISLVGEATPPDDDTVERMLAQFAWTLRQDPSIEAFTISIGGQDIRLPAGTTQFSVQGDERYDPSAGGSTPLLYGLRDGRLLSGTVPEMSPVAGPFGVEDFGLRSVAVDLSGSTLAGVSGDGRGVLTGSVGEPSTDPADPSVDEIVSGATDLLPPVYDYTGRLWLVDRTPGGAVVTYLGDGRRPTRIEIPGVSGRRVQEFLVSRDATRFVAVVRGAGGVDQVRVGRLRTSENGALRATDTAPLVFDGSEGLRVTDLVWTSTTSVGVLSPITPETLYEVLTVAVAGAPSDFSMRRSTINGKVRGLAGSPAPASLYAVTDQGVVEVGDPGILSPPEGVRTLQYAG